jgi:Protein of unknown function (DUF2510)
VDSGSELASAAGWYPDPVHRYEFRWYNGERWTADVSVDGHRFVDHPADRWVDAGAPVGVSGTPPAGQAQRPSRTLALLTFLFGIGGLVIAWMPFLFVLGALAAITALVLGPIARRRIRAGRASGPRLAVAGIVLAVIALCVSVVGFFFTRATVREFEAYSDPGPVDAEVTTCTADSSRVTVGGTVDNLDDRRHDYVIVVQVVDGDDDRETLHITVDDVAAGGLRSWTITRFVDDLDSDSLRCALLRVNGPYPFGFPQP